MTILSQIAHFSNQEVEELKKAVIAFDFSTVDDLTYDPNYPELNLYNPIDKISLLIKLTNANSFRFTQQEWYLALDVIPDKSSGTLSFVYDTLIDLNNTFYFV